VLRWALPLLPEGELRLVATPAQEWVHLG